MHGHYRGSWWEYMNDGHYRGSWWEYINAWTL